ncbi:MAG: DUF3592 domain-containing protein [Lachnospiraceae bacterium]|nr:DUF3592 domain-containing protein [Lachnospiraceae bacterium]
MYTQSFTFKNVFRAVGILFLLVGCVFLVVSAGLSVSSSKFYSNAIETEGEISRISQGRVYVTYEAEGKEMTSPLGFYTSSMRPGDSITVYYDAEDIGRIQTKTSQILNWVFLGVGVLLLFVGTGLVVGSFLKKAQGQKLLQTGLRLDGEIIGVSVNPRISSNYRHPYMIDCQAVTPDGQLRIFHSDPIWYNPTAYLTDSHIPVYVDRSNFSRYYVDTSRVLPR